jgi:hypothetical protein
LNTPFPVVVIDIHADYVKMDQRAGDGGRHGDFDVVVYYPPGASKIEGVTAEKRDLLISPKQLTNEAIIELLGATLGEMQEIVLRGILRQLRSRREAFGLGDVTAEVQAKLEEEGEKGGKLKGSERTQVSEPSKPPRGLRGGRLTASIRNKYRRPL